MRSDSAFNNSLPSVEIVEILPSISTQQLFAHEKCYIGLSLTNPIFERGNLKALFNWASENFDNCLVILGDDLCRFNQVIRFGSSPEEALKAAS